MPEKPKSTKKTLKTVSIPMQEQDIKRIESASNLLYGEINKSRFIREAVLEYADKALIASVKTKLQSEGTVKPVELGPDLGFNRIFNY